MPSRTIALPSLLSFFFAAVFAQVQQAPSGNDAVVIRYDSENNGDGSYKYSYETSNGISVQEEGFLKNPGQPELEAQTARGSYSYTAPDGQLITVNWYADETGFHATGSHIPAAPAVTTDLTTPRPLDILPQSPFQTTTPPQLAIAAEFYRG